MAMNDLFGVAGSKPKLITSYTSGTGTYVPTENNARCLVRLQGGGAGGAASGAGGGGAFIECVIRVPIAGLAYAVGAGGAAGLAGSATTFGSLFAAGAPGPTGGGVPGTGAPLGISYGSVSAIGVTLLNAGGLTGISGGGGGNASSAGGLAGYPGINDTTNYAVTPASLIGLRNSQGAQSGGNSFYGTGGTTGNSPTAGNYGAGGGANAAGLGGYIEIWDFGA